MTEILTPIFPYPIVVLLFYIIQEKTQMKTSAFLPPVRVKKKGAAKTRKNAFRSGANGFFCHI